MRLEDYAAIALVTYFTRRIDWCGGDQQESEA